MRGTILLLIVLTGLSSAAGQTPPGSEKPPERLPTIADRQRGLARQEGFLAYVWDARRGQLLLLEIRPALGEFLYGSGMARGEEGGAAGHGRTLRIGE